MHTYTHAHPSFLKQAGPHEMLSFCYFSSGPFAALRVTFLGQIAVRRALIKDQRIILDEDRELGRVFLGPWRALC